METVVTQLHEAVDTFRAEHGRPPALILVDPWFRLTALDRLARQTALHASFGYLSFFVGIPLEVDAQMTEPWKLVDTATVKLSEAIRHIANIVESRGETAHPLTGEPDELVQAEGIADLVTAVFEGALPTSVLHFIARNTSGDFVALSARLREYAHQLQAQGR